MGEELKHEGKWNTHLTHSLKLCEIVWEMGETVEFALSQISIHWNFGRIEGSIAAIRLNSPESS